MYVQTRINIGKCFHGGQSQDCYVPQYCDSNETWLDILSPNSYILKTSFNPLVVCKACGGHNVCKECRDGLRKGTPVDLKYVAEMIINSHNHKNQKK